MGPRSKWDVFVHEFAAMCLCDTYDSLNNKGLKYTNIRNLYFGDCREHEVLLHTMVKLYLKRYKLETKYLVRRLYAVGTTVKNDVANAEYWKSKTVVKPSLTMSGGTLDMSDISITSWEHTHPVIYSVEHDKLYSIDALCHKTAYNSSSADEMHRIELRIDDKTDADGSDKLVYVDLPDKQTRKYEEVPTSFSKYDVGSMKKPAFSMIFGYKFTLNRSFIGSNYYEELKIIRFNEASPTGLLCTVETPCNKPNGGRKTVENTRKK